MAADVLTSIDGATGSVLLRGDAATLQPWNAGYAIGLAATLSSTIDTAEAARLRLAAVAGGSAGNILETTAGVLAAAMQARQAADLTLRAFAASWGLLVEWVPIQQSPSSPHPDDL